MISMQCTVRSVMAVRSGGVDQVKFSRVGSSGMSEHH